MSVQEADLAELLRLYERAAIAHGLASEVGNYEAANMEYETLAAVYRELRTRGSETQNAVLGLLNHDDEYVRAWAAAHALEFAPERGEPVLTEISRTTGVRALDARMTLKEWRKGNLKFP